MQVWSESVRAIKVSETVAERPQCLDARSDISRIRLLFGSRSGCRTHRLAPQRLRRVLPESGAVVRREAAKFAEAEPHRHVGNGFGCNFRRQQRLPDLRQATLAQKTGRRGAANRPKGAGERALLHAGAPAKLRDARRPSRIGAGHRLEAVDDLLIALSS